MGVPAKKDPSPPSVDNVRVIFYPYWNKVAHWEHRRKELTKKKSIIFMYFVEKKKEILYVHEKRKVKISLFPFFRREKVPSGLDSLRQKRQNLVD